MYGAVTGIRVFILFTNSAGTLPLNNHIAPSPDTILLSAKLSNV